MYLSTYVQLCHSLFGFDSTKREVETTINERAYHLHGGCCDSNLCNIHDPSNVSATVDPSSRPPKPTGNSIAQQIFMNYVLIIE